MHITRKFWIVTGTFLLAGFLSACGHTNTGKFYDHDGPPVAGGHLRAVAASDVKIKVEQPNKWANRPYTVMGKRYYPMTGDKPLTQTGTASWYGKQFHGKKTSIGEKYNMYELSAAHPTMELPSYAKVTNLSNGRSVIVRVNDRGPFINNRIIDLSYAAAVKLGYQKAGTARVRVERITRKDIAAGKIPSTNTSGSLLAVASGISKLASSGKSDASRNSSVDKKSTLTAVTVAAASAIALSSQARERDESDKNTAAAQSINQPSSLSPQETHQNAVVEDNLVDLTDERGVPAVDLSFEVQDSEPSVVTEKNLPATVAAHDENTVSGDAIEAILSAETQLQIQNTNTAEKTSAETSGPYWSVQIGAYSVKDNAQAGAAHAESLLNQEGIGPVSVVQGGSLYKVYVGNVDTQEKATDLARLIAAKLGTQTHCVQLQP